MDRKPNGYLGRGHETIGSDILAVLHALEHLSEQHSASTGGAALAAQVLGPAAVARLRGVQPDRWYPISFLLDTLETLEAKLGNYGLRQVGRTLFKLSHRDRVVQVAQSGRDIIEGIDGMYHHANRGERIGGWRVRAFEASFAVLEKTTPHPCTLEEGILSEALMAVGSPAVISQTECLRRGAPFCVFRITPSVTGVRWLGGARSGAHTVVRPRPGAGTGSPTREFPKVELPSSPPPPMGKVERAVTREMPRVSMTEAEYILQRKPTTERPATHGAAPAPGRTRERS